MKTVRPLLNRLFPLVHYTDPVQYRQAIATYVIGVLAVASLLFGGISLLIFPTFGGVTLDSSLLIRGVLLLGATLSVILLTRRGQNRLGAGILIVIWFAIAYAVQIAGGQQTIYAYPTILLGISLSILLVGEVTAIPAVALSSVVLIVSDFVNPDISKEAGLQALPAFVSIMIIFGAINFILARGIQDTTRRMQARIDSHRLILAESTSAISQRLLATRLNLEAVTKETVALMISTFTDIDVAQLFMIDNERRNATLTATTVTSPADGSEIGQQIEVGSLNAIGRVAVGGQPILARQLGDEPVKAHSAFLPGTKTELALPLIVGQETIGILDLQSQSTTAFTPADVDLFKTVASQIAVALDNARLYTEAQNRLADNQRLYDQARSSLREIERLNQQLTSTAWTEFLRNQPAVPAFSIDLETGQVENAAEWTPTLAEASRRKQVLVRQIDNTKVVAVPITVRGQVIGAMEFEIAPDQNVGAEQITILQQVVERLGLAAENARLFEQTQRAAQREAIVNEISTRMQATTNIEAVIAAATQSLADVFQSSRVAIRLGTPTNGVS